MPSIRERVIANGRGVRAERDLAEAAADFYLLELLTAKGDADAARTLGRRRPRGDFVGVSLGSLSQARDQGIGRSSEDAGQSQYSLERTTGLEPATPNLGNRMADVSCVSARARPAVDSPADIKKDPQVSLSEPPLLGIGQYFSI
jgi:hypothetical protein